MVSVTCYFGSFKCNHITHFLKLSEQFYTFLPHCLSTPMNVRDFFLFPGQRGNWTTDRLQRPTSARTEGSTPSGTNDRRLSLGAERPPVTGGGEIGVVPWQAGQGEFHSRRFEVAHTVFARSNQIAWCDRGPCTPSISWRPVHHQVVKNYSTSLTRKSVENFKHL